MKKRVRITLEPRTPFAISRHRERHISETLDHVPGSTLRGALAATWIRERGMPDADPVFDRVFQSGRNRFPFCYPGTGFPAPAPVTARTCKAHPGPRSAGGHGIRDGALELLGWKDTGPSDTCSARDCSERLVRYGGLVAREEGGTVLRPLRETRMHAGIRRDTGTVRQGVLYGTTVVLPLGREAEGRDERPLVLEGTGAFEEEDLAALRELLGGDREGGTILVGRSRSSGLGEMKVTLEELGGGDDLETRMKAWTDGVTTGPGKEGLPVALTLVSPAILEKGGRYHFDPGEVLADRLGLVEYRSLVQEVLVFGWNMATASPKPPAAAVAAGSVVLGRSSLDRETLLERARELELDGFGARTQEGFGRVLAWDPVLLGDVR